MPNACRALCDNEVSLAQFSAEGWPGSNVQGEKGFDFPFTIHLESGSGVRQGGEGLLHTRCSHRLSAPLFFVCGGQNENVIYNLFHLHALVPGRYTTEENVKSRMFIILLNHGHHSHSLAQ